MEQIPPPIPAQFIGYRNLDPDRPPARPAGVTIVAILGIVLGALELLRSGLMVARYGLSQIYYAPHLSTRLVQIHKIVLCLYSLGFVLAGLLVTFAIATLATAGWARRGMLVWAWAFIGMTIVWIVFWNWRFSIWTFVTPLSTSTQTISAPIAARVIYVLRQLMHDMPRVAGLILSGCVLGFFTSRRAKAAFGWKASANSSTRNA